VRGGRGEKRYQEWLEANYAKRGGNA
jgi:hypothetical protein